MASEEFVEERVYVIPLRDVWRAPRKRRAPRAIRLIREFISRHMKAETVKVANDVNEKIWERGAEKPPRKIKVRAAKDKEGKVTVYLA